MLEQLVRQYKTDNKDLRSQVQALAKNNYSVEQLELQVEHLQFDIREQAEVHFEEVQQKDMKIHQLMKSMYQLEEELIEVKGTAWTQEEYQRVVKHERKKTKEAQELLEVEKKAEVKNLESQLEDEQVRCSSIQEEKQQLEAFNAKLKEMLKEK